MASIVPHRDGYRAQVYVEGRRASKSFPTRKEAAQWALETEAQLRGVSVPDQTLAAACDKFSREETDARGGGHWERIRLARFIKDGGIAARRLETLDARDFAQWRDDRLRQHKSGSTTKTISPGTVARELNLLRAVLEVARREWRWLRENPLDDVRWPKTPKGRARGVPADAIVAISKALGVWERPLAVTKRNRVGLAFLFSLETGMRSGEICALRWPDVHKKERYVTVRKSKNGDERDVPLTVRAVELLEALPLGFGPVFGLTDVKRDALFRKHRPEAWRDVHFHDARSEAISRLSKKMDVLELARVVGQRDINSLLHYYKANVTDIARRLG